MNISRMARLGPLGAGCLALALLAGCAAVDSNGNRRTSTQSQTPTSDPPVNPYSNGGFSDPGPNYPPTGH